MLIKRLYLWSVIYDCTLDKKFGKHFLTVYVSVATLNVSKCHHLLILISWSVRGARAVLFNGGANNIVL